MTRVIRFTTGETCRAPEGFGPLPEHLLGIRVDGFMAVATLTESMRGQPWFAGARMYRRVGESSTYELVDDLETYMWRFPAIRWDEPVKVVRLDGSAEGYFCRVCIARDGLSAEQVRGRAMSMGDALAHIRREHAA